MRVAWRAGLVINNGQALLAAALAGAGVVVQPDVLLGPAIGRGDLVRLLPDWNLPPRPLHVVRLPEARPSANLRTFVDFVVERLGPDAPRRALTAMPQDRSTLHTASTGVVRDSGGADGAA